MEPTKSTKNKFEDQEKLFAPESDDEPSSLDPSQRKLITQPVDLLVRTIVEEIDDQTLNPQPSFQRGYVWDDTKASALIESLLLNIPIPVCYFSDEENGKQIVIDGHQRLFSIWRYVRNHFALKGLKQIKELNGIKFIDLSEKDQRIIQGRTIRCIVITQDSNPELKFEVFERLNTGAMQATDQEIRNAVYHGDFNDLLKTLASLDIWLNVLGKKKLDIRMRDEELILRFFAVHENYLKYQAPLRVFLNEFIEGKTYINPKSVKRQRIKMSEEQKKYYSDLFSSTMEKVLIVFKDHSFRAYLEGKWERQVNKALFDVITLVFSKIPNEQIEKNASLIDSTLIKLFFDKEFLDATSGSKAHKSSFAKRIKLFSQAMADIGMNTEIHTSFPESD